jgi:hypothetical protein
MGEKEEHKSKQKTQTHSTPRKKTENAQKKKKTDEKERGFMLALITERKMK